jgi:hypothetical protein
MALTPLRLLEDMVVHALAGKKLVNIEVVREVRPPSGAHSDTMHDELAWVVLNAGGLVD